MIVVIGFELARTSLEKILNPAPVVFSVPVAVVLLASIAVKLWMYLFNRYLGRHIQSQALLATAADSRNDAISTAAVLFAGVVEALSSWQIDGVMGLVVALFILYSGWTLARETISPLLGEAASPELRDLIVETVRSHPKVLGYHDLMVHDYGPGQRFGSLHVEMDRREDPMACHEIIDNLERACLEKHNVHLVIHYDPVVVDDPVVDTCRRQVTEILQEMDARLHIHDFRMVAGNGHTNLIFDVALPSDLSGREKEIRGAVEAGMAARRGGIYYAVITFDPVAFNME